MRKLGSGTQNENGMMIDRNDLANLSEVNSARHEKGYDLAANGKKINRI
ncbi:MAG: hypothetical protein ACLTW9_24070 [Enterocloster sp.]